MMDKIRTLIFYSVATILLLIVYHYATSFGFVTVDEGYRNMEPVVVQREVKLVDKRRSTILSLEPGDIIAYTFVQRDGKKRMFGRVLALPGSTIRARGKHILVDREETVAFRRQLAVLATGVMVPRKTVFVTFDSSRGANVPIAQRMVPYRNIIGRMSDE